MPVTHKFEVSFDSLDATGNLTNPDFESDITGWGEADLTTAASLTPSHNTDTAHTRPGSAGSMKLINTASNEDDYMDDGFTTVSGRRYTISAWVKVVSYGGPAVFDRGLFVHEVGGSSNQRTDTLTAPEADGGWHRLSVEFPSTHTGAFVRLYAPMGTTYWDDVQIVEWIDLSSRLLEVPSVRFGVDGDLDEMQPGTASFRLDNRDRALEPGYTASVYFPNVRPLRRCRYQINDGSTDWDQFYGYVASWGPAWDGMNQEAYISAVDGTMILENDRLPLLDPPEAETYEQVVMHDKPFAYYTFDDVEGTQVKAVTGDDMVAVGRPKFGVAGLLVGDAGTAMQLTGVLNQYARAAITAGQFGDTNKISVGGWFQPTVLGVNQVLLRGPEVASTDHAFVLRITSGNLYQFDVVSAAGLTATTTSTTLAGAGRTDFVFGVWDGYTNRLYVNGVEEDSTSGTLTIGTGTAELFIWIGDSGGTLQFVADEVEFHETALTADRIMARYQAGAEHGHGTVMAGERVAEIVDTGLWGLSDIDTGHHEVAPVQYHGQSRMDALRDAVRAEFPEALFYFPGTNNPRYLGWNYGDTSPYNTVQAVFGNQSGEIPFIDIATTDEDDIYNIVTTSREGGLAQTATDPDSEAEFFPRNYTLTGLIHTEDMSCLEVSGAILAFHSQPEPPQRILSITLSGEETSGLAEILERMPGDLIRIKHRPRGGTAIDIVTRIRGRTLSVAPLDGGNRVITCTWTVARGFNAAAGFWRAGITGFSEASDTTVAA